MRNIICGAMTLVLVAFFSIISYSQASGSLAELRGQATDSNGGAIANAKVTITDRAKGTVRTGVTDAEGKFGFLQLLPSSYDLKVEAQGFAVGTARVELTVGQQAVLPIVLATGQVQAQMDVVAGLEVVETQRTEQASTVDAKQIVSLPINRRNFLDYALLTPGVASSENITDAQDYRVAQTPQSGLSFGGNNGRGNMVQVDGAETLSASGGVQATLSQEGVQEFQVVRNSFSAEFGGASGGIVNIVSKSGSNSVRGSAFGLFRDQTFDARNAFDFNPDGKSPFNRQQYGGSVGGPLKKDKAFIFGVFEQLNQKRTAFINLLTDPNLFQVNTASTNPTVQQEAALFDYIANSTTAPAALKTGAAQLRGALTTTNYPGTVSLFTKASGQFPFGERQSQLAGRFDYIFSNVSSLYVRMNYTNANFENQATGALTAVSRGRRYTSNNGGLVATHNYQFSSSTFNEFKFQYSDTRTSFLPNETLGPEYNISGFGLFNRQIFLPSENAERHFDFYENLTKVIGNHAFKFGGSAFIHHLDADNQTYFGGRFDFGQAIPLANLLGSTGAAQVSNGINQFLLANPGSPYKDANGNGLADIFETPMTALQSFNLGLPIVYQQGFGTSLVTQWYARYGLYAQDTWKASKSLTLNYGLRYAIHDEPLGVPTSKKDWQPRLGFSWDPFGKGKTVIRGGAGIFTGFLNNAIANVTTTLSGTGDPRNISLVLATPTSSALGLPTSISVWGTLASRGILGTRPIQLSDVNTAPLNINPGPGLPLEVRFRLEPHYRNPTTYQTSFGLQQDLGGGYSLEATYMFTRGIHLSRNRDINQLKRTGPVNPLNPLGGATFIRFPTAAQVGAGLTSDFANPLRFQDNVYEETGNSFYHALTLQAQKRFSRHFSVNTHYTFSKSIDEVTDFNSDWSAQNPLNLRTDRSLSAFDQRHRFVASAVIQSASKSAFLTDWVFAPIFVAQSGRPFNLLMGSDSNGDGRSQSDRPGLAGRNTGVGEAFYSFDFRIGRRFFAKESRYLELTAEAFNLLNRTNFSGVNNVLGAACTDSTQNFIPCTISGATVLSQYNLRGRRDRRPTDPLGFTSAFDPRQMQFGIRYNF